jgi:DNA-binding response OmpR family regulator
MTGPSQPLRLLIVEDNANLARGLRHNFELEGFEVEVAHEGVTALRTARRAPPDLLILDLMIPKPDGYQVLRELREQGVMTPVIVLTARTEEADKLRGFRLGADDYVTKPFSVLELIARASALLRRSGGRTALTGTASSDATGFGEVRVDSDTHTVTLRGRPVSLRPKEFTLLLALLKRGGKIATRHELLNEVWGYRPEVLSRTVDTHVGELRRKLEDDPSRPRHILTVRKTGYRLAR